MTIHESPSQVSAGEVKVSRRTFLGASAGALVLSVGLPGAFAKLQAKTGEPGANVAAFLEIKPNSQVLFRSPFIEGGQGVFTAMAQIIGEELDVAPDQFIVEGAPAGQVYQILNGMRVTGGSMSVRMSYDTLRKLGASARYLLLQAGAAKLGVPAEELTTEPGFVVHKKSKQKASYGELAATASEFKAPSKLELRAKDDFRWIGKSVPRIDVLDKSTGKAEFSIDTEVDGMLYAAVVHAPHLGKEPKSWSNEAEVKEMPGVDSIHKLPGAVAVVATSWWRARKAVEALKVTWETGKDSRFPMPEAFSSAERIAHLKTVQEPKLTGEKTGNTTKALAQAAQVVEASYDAPYVVHGQLEPPSALARWNDDGTLELWIPNQAPEMFQAHAAQVAGIEADKIIIHSPLLGGFFGRHFLYDAASPYPQAIALSKTVGKPIKLLWSREEEFLRDAVRPAGVATFKAGLDENGKPIALEAANIGEGPGGRWFGRKEGKADDSFLEGIRGKSYEYKNHLVSDIRVLDPALIGFWRSVGHSMNDFFYESFFDEMADAGKQDPYELRLELLANKPRQKHLLEQVADLSGGWKRGPYTAKDGSKRARGVAMASPFGTEVATIAEVSIDKEVVVHDVWVAIDPGSIVNPAVIKAQVEGAVALGTSITLVEELTYENGQPHARNFDRYPILNRSKMPKVHVRIIESGEAMGGIGEPGLPGVLPAIVNAVCVLHGQRIRSLPLSKTQFA
ncbi:xanthine dehydrogenase family protein molybdopterin-binding subunit [Halioxenophilus aromaticivorans]|uniref:Xanthine dehydrogenase family protein molybdopterin-binding subunit n=1 Tax=Halioxenophilus aromaticivorans TaxID=1306992 RepID=A0AAV3U2Y7_9ALTE